MRQQEVRVPPEEIAFEKNKRRMAVAFLLVVALMLVVCAILVYVVLRNRPDTSTAPVVGTGIGAPEAAARATRRNPVVSVG